MSDRDIDLLSMIVVTKSQSRKLMSKLNRKHFYFTIIDSSSGFFSETTVCLLLGLNHQRMEALNKLIRRYCQPYRKFVPVQIHPTGELSHLPVLETQESGATLYVFSVEHFEQI